MIKTSLILLAFTLFAIKPGYNFSGEKSVSSKISFSERVETIYSNLNEPELSREAFKQALNGYFQLLSTGEIKKKNIITVADFSISANQERLFIIDIHQNKVIHKSLVSHGRNTGDEYAKYFSNNMNSFQSSLGFFVTSNTYNGKHGMSLRLKGMEKNINDRALDRGIVIHVADYVNQDFIKKNGRLGRSQGCPALPAKDFQKVIEILQEGTCFFIYFPDKNYQQTSPFVSKPIEDIDFFSSIF